MKFPGKTYLDCLEKAALLFEVHNLNFIEYRTIKNDLLKDLKSLDELNDYLDCMLDYKLIDKVYNTVDDDKYYYVLSPVVGDFFHTKKVLARDAYACLANVPIFEKTFNEFGTDDLPNMDILFPFWKKECGVFMANLKRLNNIYESNLDFYCSCPENVLKNMTRTAKVDDDLLIGKATQSIDNTGDVNDLDVLSGRDTTTGSTYDNKEQAVSSIMMDMWRLIEEEITPKVNAGKNKKELLIQLEDMGDTLKFIKARIETLKGRIE